MQKNLSLEIENYFQPLIYNFLREVSEFAEFDGTRIFMVGGIVRDILLKRKNIDIDIIVEGNAVEFVKKLCQKHTKFRTSSFQNELFTAKVKLPNNNIEVDFASTRTEFYPQKGYLPKIEKIGVPINQDALRRDFSINALYLSLNKNDWGNIYDFFNGIKHLEDKKLSILHNKSFVEDPTRIIRGLKFSCRLNFDLCKETQNLQNEYLKDINYNISYARVKSEIIQTFNLNNPQVYEKFISQNIYKLISKNFSKIENIKNTVNVINKFTPQSKNLWLIYFITIFFDSLKNNKITQFNFTQKEQSIINSAIILMNKPTPASSTNSMIYKFFEGHLDEAIIIYNTISENNIGIKYLSELKDVKISITGKDLIKLGLSPSPRFKEILQQVKDAKLDGQLYTKQDEIDFVNKIKNTRH